MCEERQDGDNRLDSLYVIAEKVFDSVEEALFDLESEIARAPLRRGLPIEATESDR